ncbi:MAG: glycosyltransferase family 39 protein [Thermoanaerobaculia bacterium]
MRSSALPRPALLALAWMFLVGAAIALRPILPIDETRYVSVAWEMWVRGDFLVPHLNGVPYSDKPPLLFWMFHLGWWFFGVNDWWPRVVPALFALANLGLTARLARRLWPDRPEVAGSAPAVLLGFLIWSVFTTMVMFDMLVAFCVLLALLGLEEAWRRGGVRPWLQVGGALGVGILAKGPVVLVLPLAVAFSAPWWGREIPRQFSSLWWPRLAGAVGLTAAIALAWALPAAASGGPDYANAILVSQTEQRVVYSYAHNHPWWWYLPLLPLLLYPYSFWPPLWKAVFAALAALRRRAADPGLRFCLAWLVPGLLVFSLISGKQPHYLLPLMPCFALIAARLLTETGVPVRRWHLLPALSLLVLTGAALVVVPLLSPRLGPRHGLPSWSPDVSLGMGVTLIALAAASFLLFDRIFARRTAAPTLITLALVIGVHLGLSEAAREAYDLEPIARYLSVAEKQGRPIAYVGDYHGQFHFLGRLERPLQEIPGGSESLWIRQNPRGKVIQDLKYMPPDVNRAEFTQPYRDDVLAVWGREGIPGG